MSPLNFLGAMPRELNGVNKKSVFYNHTCLLFAKLWKTITKS